MKKHLVIAAAFLSFAALTAGEIAVKGNFTVKPQAKYPTGWVNDRSSVFKPEPKFEIIQENGQNVVHFTEINGKHGFSWSSTARPAVKAGDVIRVTAKVKGSGKVMFGLETFTKERKWIMPLPKVRFDLTPEWKKIKVDLEVLDKHATRKAGFAMVVFGAASKSELYISDLKAELIPASDKK